MNTTALILVDIQYDFMPGGNLAVEEGDQVVPVANFLVDHPDIDLVVATQDWHPPNHKSFASNNESAEIGDVIDLNGLDQMMWPDHCVQESAGAQFHEDLDMRRVERIFLKGTDPEIDSYSGFYDNGHQKSTGLAEFLRANDVEAVCVVGLATDYCVKFTALDAVQEGFETTVVPAGCRAVEDHEGALREMSEAGVLIGGYDAGERYAE